MLWLELGVLLVCVADSPATPPWPEFDELVLELPMELELPEFDAEFWLLVAFDADEFKLPLDELLELFAADSLA